MAAGRWIYRGRIVQLAVERVLLPNGREVELEIVHHGGAAAVVPVGEDGDVTLVRQYRHAARESWLLEVPAGTLRPGEEPATCAHRELAEEVGLAAGRLEELGSIWTTPGFTDERIWLFLARDLAPAAQALDPAEVLSVVRIPLDEAVERALDGELADGKSVCALLRAAAFLRGGSGRLGK